MLFAARTRDAEPFGSATRPCFAKSSSPSAMSPSALSAAPWTASYNATSQPARANTMAQARPIRPDPMMATRGMATPSHPEFLPAQLEIVAQQFRCTGPRHRTALQDHGAVGEREREIEVVIDDHHPDLVAQAVERLEQLLGDRGRQALERLIEQQQPHVARESARDRDHLLLAAGEIIGGRVPALRKARENPHDALIIPMHAGTGLALEPAEREVVGDGHACEQAPALRHITD